MIESSGSTLLHLNTFNVAGDGGLMAMLRDSSDGLVLGGMC